MSGIRDMYERTGISPYPFWLAEVGAPDDAVAEIAERNLTNYFTQAARAKIVPARPYEETAVLVSYEDVSPQTVGTHAEEVHEAIPAVIEDTVSGADDAWESLFSKSTFTPARPFNHARHAMSASARVGYRLGRRWDSREPATTKETIRRSGSLFFAALALAHSGVLHADNLPLISEGTQLADCATPIARMDFKAVAALSWIAKDKNGQTSIAQPVENGKVNPQSTSTTGSVDIIACPTKDEAIIVYDDRVVLNLGKLTLKPVFNSSTPLADSVQFEKSDKFTNEALISLSKTANDPTAIAGIRQRLRAKALTIAPTECIDGLLAGAAEHMSTKLSDEYPGKRVEVVPGTANQISGAYRKAIGKSVGPKSAGVGEPRIDTCEPIALEGDQ